MHETNGEPENGETNVQPADAADDTGLASAPQPGPEAPRVPKRWWQRRGRIELVFWVAFAAVLVWALVPRDGAGDPAGDAKPAPPLHATLVTGEPITLEQFRGKVVLVNFWATWCPPCRQEMPGFQRVWEKRKDDGLVILGISEDDFGPEPVKEFLKAGGYTYPVAMWTKELDRDFGVRMLPVSFLVDREGRVRKVVQGVFEESVLEEEVARLLKEGT